MNPSATVWTRLRAGLNRALGDTLARRIFILLWVTLVVAQAAAIGTMHWVRGWDLEISRVPVAPGLPPMPGLMPSPRNAPDDRNAPPPPALERRSADERAAAGDGAASREMQEVKEVPSATGAQGPQGPQGAQGAQGAQRFGDPGLGERDRSASRGVERDPDPDRFRPDPRDRPLPGGGAEFGSAGADDRNGPSARPGAFRGLSTRELLLDYGVRLLVTGLAAWLASRWLARPMRELVQASQALGRSLNQQAPLPLLNEQRGTLEVRESAQVFNAMARQLRRQFNERGLMVAAISHDLRTPLTRLRMRLETLDIPELQRVRSVEDIREMNALVDAVMELFRGDGPGASEPLQDVDLAALAMALTDDRIEQALPVRFLSGDDPVLAKGQPMALRRVLGNLIDNALRYGVRADIQVGQDAQGPWVRVMDAGPGIPPDKLESVFEPFYRLEDSRNRHTGGAGLGLYIARELTLRQRGSLVLNNRPEGGLVAELRLTSE
ncbi:ATP-binding protein [Roseateles amylovorans]|uniref:histidine kinase n=1 Tax=Roseateles amylovorans TaxID=2978473 RepID=A0ABY6AW97_9BURK|nr:ATP-binding protein [Roseateles amylovorans]UXH76674.1 ATP-binding protein [Roseateles amylovorans]